MKKAYIVTLNDQGRAPRPSYGPFLWNNEYGRYAWRGEVATSMGQLAELFTQAAAFLREQDNYYLVLGATEVPWPEKEPETVSQNEPIPQPPETPTPEAVQEEVALPRKAPRRKIKPATEEQSSIPSTSPFETP